MKSDKLIIYIMIKPIIYILLKILYRPKYIDTHLIPQNGPIIVCGNHVHAFDPLLAIASNKRTLHFLAKKELFKFGFGLILRSIGTIPVDRSKKDNNATDYAQKYLKDGKALAIFPESTRNKTNELLLPFKYGSVSLAKKTGALIVPYAIVNKYKLFRKSVTVIYDEPIDITNMDMNEANEYLKKSIKNILESNGSI